MVSKRDDLHTMTGPRLRFKPERNTPSRERAALERFRNLPATASDEQVMALWQSLSEADRQRYLHAIDRVKAQAAETKADDAESAPLKARKK